VILIIGKLPQSRIKAHQEILGSRSSFFEAIFQGAEKKKAAQASTTMEIDLPDKVNEGHFRELVQAIYAGKWPTTALSHFIFGVSPLHAAFHYQVWYQAAIHHLPNGIHHHP